MAGPIHSPSKPEPDPVEQLERRRPDAHPSRHGCASPRRGSARPRCRSSAARARGHVAPVIETVGRGELGAACAAHGAMSTSPQDEHGESILRIAPCIPGAAPAQTRREVLGVDVRAARGCRGPSGARRLVAALQGVEVVNVLVEEAQGGVAVVRGAVAGHDRVGGLDQRRQAGERGAVVGQRAAWMRSSGSRPGTGSRRRTAPRTSAPSPRGRRRRGPRPGEARAPRSRARRCREQGGPAPARAPAATGRST